MTKKQYTHKGLFCGICPVYINLKNEECPDIIERHWSLSPLLAFTEILFGICVFIRTLFDEKYQPMYPIKVTGELND